MTIINHTNTTEFECHKFSTGASDIGLRLGEWPESLPTELGNGQPFLRQTKKLDAEGDLMWVTYRQSLGCISLRVFND